MQAPRGVIQNGHVRVEQGDAAALGQAGPVQEVAGARTDVEVQSRCRDQLLTVVVGRDDGAYLVLALEQIGAEPHAGRQERHPPRRGLEPEQEHALVELERGHGPRLARLPEVRLERDRVERAKRVHDLLHLQRVVGSGGEVGAQVVRLAARPPREAHEAELVGEGWRHVPGG